MKVAAHFTRKEVHQILCIGDALDVCRSLPSRSCHCCVTSPPYFRLRDYSVPGQLGLEETPDKYVSRLVEVFREIRRILRDDGTLWIVLGDGFADNTGHWHARLNEWSRGNLGHGGSKYDAILHPSRTIPPGLKPKDLLGIPWRVALALQEDGWTLRADIIWHKPNALPESVRDRPVHAYEYIILLSKSKHYYFDYQQFVNPSNHQASDAFDNPHSTIKKAERWTTDKASTQSAPHAGPLIKPETKSIHHAKRTLRLIHFHTGLSRCAYRRISTSTCQTLYFRWLP
ncbi:site-specific DNA-methyltransferase [Alicyclobacillus hesperidum]|uniref:DNA-methyltransferase n=1 Tax=Alicyclobacillus hesperidum TaxID=89784 RepID=UPI000C1FA315